MRRLLLLLALALPVAADEADLADLTGIEPVREWFEAAAGSPRLIVVFSPT